VGGRVSENKNIDHKILLKNLHKRKKKPRLQNDSLFCSHLLGYPLRSVLDQNGQERASINSK
jgi:hypothetical protein